MDFFACDTIPHGFQNCEKLAILISHGNQYDFTERAPPTDVNSRQAHMVLHVHQSETRSSPNEHADLRDANCA
eukprot:scaffold605888_cov20-Prasinocladus_malaysianus.AAC.1